MTLVGVHYFKYVYTTKEEMILTIHSTFFERPEEEREGIYQESGAST